MFKRSLERADKKSQWVCWITFILSHFLCLDLRVRFNIFCVAASLCALLLCSPPRRPGCVFCSCSSQKHLNLFTMQRAFSLLGLIFCLFPSKTLHALFWAKKLLSFSVLSRAEVISSSFQRSLCELVSPILRE